MRSRWHLNLVIALSVERDNKAQILRTRHVPAV
jgi:hypothetical protein